MTKRKTTAQKHRTLLIAKQGGKCCYCERRLLHHMTALENGNVHPRAATIEHLRRRCEGGSNHLDNKAVACHECNTSRGSTDWLTYKSLKMGELVA
ncbi:HNH endonuclease [Shinella zoogloeoides]|uniref:HNH endonuclease n=1 Tax=Shinella zoogloeoides TaxID=352475 RepID=UPI001F593C4D|nr:HNH endonuclease [Shinella zoogloeoides]